MISLLTQLLIGFSIVSAAILLIAYVFFLKEMQKTTIGLVACTCLLVGLTGLQLAHLDFLLTGADLFNSTAYVLLLLAVPPAFYFFSREILLPDSNSSVLQIVHLVPLSLAFWLPANLVIPAALTIGVGYSVWFARFVFGMRRQVRRFRFEMFFFGFFAILAVLVLILAILVPYVDSSVFFIAYADFTGIAIMLIVAALIVFPELLSDISDAARLTYASSTLNDVNAEEKLELLDHLMNEEKLFQNENLNLGMLAEAMALSSHQVSELINTHFGFGFSRYVRERRIAEAKQLFRDDSNSSVLSISLMSGFKSQSNFYTAFREITGEAPGTFRKNLRKD